MKYARYGTHRKTARFIKVAEIDTMFGKTKDVWTLISTESKHPIQVRMYPE